jgi:hypothetical protein
MRHTPTRIRWDFEPGLGVDPMDDSNNHSGDFRGSPKELTARQDCANGANVLLQTSLLIDPSTE